jgi:hypothetical protein
MAAFDVVSLFPLVAAYSAVELTPVTDAMSGLSHADSTESAPKSMQIFEENEISEFVFVRMSPPFMVNVSA